MAENYITTMVIDGKEEQFCSIAGLLMILGAAVRSNETDALARSKADTLLDSLLETAGRKGYPSSDIAKHALHSDTVDISDRKRLVNELAGYLHANEVMNALGKLQEVAHG